jgi:valyl-tRNA synthetase
MLLTSPAGNDLPFDEKLCETGRNFSNKIWNAFRLVRNWEIDESIDQPQHAALAVEWMESRTNAALIDLESQYSEFRLSEALMTSYRLVWEEFCSWYLELVKPVYGEPIDRKTLDATYVHFERLVKILHPFMPFLTEEVWSWLGDRKTAKDALIVAHWPKAGEVDASLLKNFDVLKEIVGGVRNVRNDNGIANKEKLELRIQKDEGYPDGLSSAISHLTNLQNIEEVNEKVEGAFGFMIGRHRFYIPFGDGFDVEVEKEKIKKDLDYQKGFLKSVRGKLSNERFVSGAPESVVVNERKKEDDALAKIAIMEEKLADLG